jgi:hypothetical protein
MKRTTSVLVILFACLLCKSQDSLRRFEFGSTLVTINSFSSEFYAAPDRPAAEYLNGLFFRYNINRIAFRAHASYSENAASYASSAGWSDGTSGDVINKDLRIGVGVQYSLLKRKEWLYTFFDLSYRNLYSTGHQYGGIWGANERYTSTANGFDIFAGFGLKIRTLKNVFLSPEMGYYSSAKIVNKSSTQLVSGKTSQGNYNEVNINAPVLKLHLTVRF